MPALGQSRPFTGPLGVALFFAVLGAFSIGAGIASLDDSLSPPNSTDSPLARADVEEAEGRLLADVAELMEIRAAAGESPVEHGVLLVPIRDGAPQRLRIDQAQPPLGGKLVGVGVSLLVIAGLLYLLYPPSPTRGR